MLIPSSSLVFIELVIRSSQQQREKLSAAFYFMALFWGMMRIHEKRWINLECEPQNKDLCMFKTIRHSEYLQGLGTKARGRYQRRYLQTVATGYHLSRWMGPG